MKNKLTLILLLLLAGPSFSQVVYQDLSDRNIYDFVEELADLKLVSVNSAIKPYSRVMIAEWLRTADAMRDKLNKRQNRELDFYLREYNLELKNDLSWYKKGKGLLKNSKNAGIPLNPLSFQYKDTLFTFSLKPVWGYNFYYGTEDGETTYHQWGGAEVFGYIGKHWGFYSNLRDHHEDVIRVSPFTFSREEGASWKFDGAGGGDYSEMRGGISYEWKWGHVAFTKDHFQWGDNYAGANIFSGIPPSFPYFQLRMTPARWFDYTFITGWMVSQVIDSTETYRVQAGVRFGWFKKYLSAAMMTFTPVKGLNISAGGSVVSSSEKYNPALLSPFLFYLNYDYSGTEYQKKFFGTNASFFMNVSSRQIRHLHLYASVFADDPDADALSLKGGVHGTFGNFSGTVEYTQSGKEVFTNDVATLTFASNRYNLGYYLRNDSKDLFLAVKYKALRGLHFSLNYEKYSVPGMDKDLAGFLAEYEFISNAYLRTGVNADLSGNTSEIFAGFNIGF